MCTKAVLDEITREVAREARRQLGDKLDKVILYGSYARGDYDAESDIDIMVLADIALEERWQTSKLLSRKLGWLDLKHDVLISLNVTDCATFYKYLDALPFYGNVMKDGVELHAG